MCGFAGLILRLLSPDKNRELWLGWSGPATVCYVKYTRPELSEVVLVKTAVSSVDGFLALGLYLSTP